MSTRSTHVHTDDEIARMVRIATGAEEASPANVIVDKPTAAPQTGEEKVVMTLFHRFAGGDWVTEPIRRLGSKAGRLIEDLEEEEVSEVDVKELLENAEYNHKGQDGFVPSEEVPDLF